MRLKETIQVVARFFSATFKIRIIRRRVGSQKAAHQITEKFGMHRIDAH
jgi:hypothetical protein